MNSVGPRFRAAIAGVAFTLVLSCAAQKPTLTVGSPIEVKMPASITQITANPAQFVGQTVRLEGTVSKVCKGMGCWVEVQAADGSAILARSLDHTILLPTDCEGRKIVLQGVMSEIPAEPAAETGEAAKPEDSAEGHEDQPAHECPKPTYLVATSGIELY